MLRRLAAMLLLFCFGSLGQAGLAGTYKGKWTGGSASGDFEIRLAQATDGWSATVQFTLGENAIPTTVRMLKVTNSTIDITYDFDLGGNKLQSHLVGEVKQGSLTGKYQTKSLADNSSVDEGTCEAKR